MNYIQRHWRGELSLAKSFWVNFVLLTFVFESLLIASIFVKNIDVILGFRIAVIYFSACVLLIYPWQTVGLWRSCNEHIMNKNRWFWVRITQIIIVLSVITNITVLVITSPLLLFYTKTAFFQNRADYYSLQVINEGKVLFFNGRIVPGLSSDVKKILNNNPQIEGIILTTQGGKREEGRRLANIISQYQLNTYVTDYCISAGTYGFLAGKERYITKDSFIGFHQGGFSSNPVIFGIDNKFLNDRVDDSQESFYLSKGINKEFVNKARLVPHEEIWLPTFKELLDAGVIHGLVDQDLQPIEDYSLEDDQYRVEMIKIMREYGIIKLYEPAD